MSNKNALINEDGMFIKYRGRNGNFSKREAETFEKIIPQLPAKVRSVVRKDKSSFLALRDVATLMFFCLGYIKVKYGNDNLLADEEDVLSKNKMFYTSFNEATDYRISSVVYTSAPIVYRHRLPDYGEFNSQINSPQIVPPPGQETLGNNNALSGAIANVEALGQALINEVVDTSEIQRYANNQYIEQLQNTQMHYPTSIMPSEWGHYTTIGDAEAPRQ